MPGRPVTGSARPGPGIIGPYRAIYGLYYPIVIKEWVEYGARMGTQELRLQDSRTRTLELRLPDPISQGPEYRAISRVLGYMAVSRVPGVHGRIQGTRSTWPVPGYLEYMAGTRVPGVHAQGA